MMADNLDSHLSNDFSSLIPPARNIENASHSLLGSTSIVENDHTDENVRLVQSPGIAQYIGDFFNTFKVFIGTNYLSLPFAFMNSGLLFGIPGVILVACLTDHCCMLIIHCKHIIIERMLEKEQSCQPMTLVESKKHREHLSCTIGYGEIGYYAFGKYIRVLIDLTIAFTQFMTVVCYYIFLGNSIMEIFPLLLKEFPLTNSTVINTTMSTTSVNEKDFSWGSGIPMLSIFENYQSTNDAKPTEQPRPDPPSPHYIQYSSAPDLRYLVLMPLPFFILTTMVRNLRLLSPLTFIASLSLFGGATAVLFFLINGFTVIDNFKWYKFGTLPLFLGQLTGAYEGIGCILPIETSMEGNREVFPIFLHFSVALVCLILSSFGILGYLRYGESVEQIILLSIPQHSLLAIVVDITLIISVLFTYPIQNFPIIGILEKYIFKAAEVPAEAERTVNGYDSYSQVSTWKRNLLRLILTLVAAGSAVIMRNSYAFASAFSGAVGCSLIAYIIPCFIHLKLKYLELSTFIIVKNWAIIILSIIVSILVVAVIIDEAI